MIPFLKPSSLANKGLPGVFPGGRAPKAVESMRAALAAAAALCLAPWVAEAFSPSSMLSSSRCFQHASLREICDAVAIVENRGGRLRSRA